MLHEKKVTPFLHHKEPAYDSDELEINMLENSSNEDEITAKRDMNTLQDTLFSSDQTEETYHEQNMSFTYTDSGIIHLKERAQSMFEW